ncbi:MAG: homoserine O-acetyltransferase/O-succinyltransferase family protein [Caulobacteraceae bacterium]
MNELKDHSAGIRQGERPASADAALAAIRPLRIGLVNNMPDGAYQVAERRFGQLMGAAAGPRGMEMRMFALPGVERSPAIAARMAARYQSAEDIPAAGLDALVVTGAEGRTTDLRDEAFWPAFAQLADWAALTRTPTLWSCMAAHAAVLHFDGVARQRLPGKCSGVFAVDRVGPDLGRAAGAGWMAPHSRYNTLREADLVGAGYALLTHSAQCGVDSFVRDGDPFLFCQGHPEYDADALALEYRRDMLRYLRREREAPPALPEHYFTADAEAELSELTARALDRREPELIEAWPNRPQLRHPQAPWRELAIALYADWLQTAT